MTCSCKQREKLKGCSGGIKGVARSGEFSYRCNTRGGVLSLSLKQKGCHVVPDHCHLQGPFEGFWIWAERSL